MNSIVLVNILRFIVLIAAQALLFNKFNFNGYINPHPYILFIILYPVNGNKNVLLISAFLLGLIVDMFQDTAGIHATACLVLAYLRDYIFKFSFGLSYEYQTVKLNDSLTPERFSFILIAVFIHHFILFLLDIFSVEYIWGTILRTLFSMIFTIILCIIIIYLFKPSKR